MSCLFIGCLHKGPACLAQRGRSQGRVIGQAFVDENRAEERNIRASDPDMEPTKHDPTAHFYCSASLSSTVSSRNCFAVVTNNLRCFELWGTRIKRVRVGVGVRTQHPPSTESIEESAPSGTTSPNLNTLTGPRQLIQEDTI